MWKKLKATTSFHQLSYRANTKRRKTKAIRGLFVWCCFPVSEKRLMKCYVWPERHGWIWSLVLREGLSEERSLSFPLSISLCPSHSLSLAIHSCGCNYRRPGSNSVARPKDSRLCIIVLNIDVSVCVLMDASECINKCVRLFIYFFRWHISGRLSVEETATTSDSSQHNNVST